ncbi:hypothetical protein Tco_0137623, partial [Tanacetum coccineum]
MLSDNASSAVTYTSISSYSNGLSQGIPLVNVGELPEMDLYEEVAQQGQAHPLSPAYVPNPIELDKHVPVENQPYVNDASPTAESPGHIADSESMEENSIDYPNEPEDDDEYPEEDLEEDHTDYPANGEDGDDEPSDDDDDNDDTDDEDEEPTKDEEEKEHLALANPSTTRLRRERKTVRLEPPMSASMEVRIIEHVAAPIPPTSPAYDQAPL